jgi:U32 family peptidase
MADRSSAPAPELLAPAGQWDCAKAAVENGADAIYFGLEKFNARMRAENFTEADLPELMAFLHQRGVKGYVTFNTLVFPAELVEAEQYLRTVIAAGVDAAIVQDIGLCRLIRHLSPNFPIHASTQMTVTSAAGVEFARSLGCQLVVLARECSMAEITKIHQQAALPLEVFVHGALCVAYSGQCLTSEALGGRSANRGECAQACRMPYDLLADGREVNLGDRKYLLSPQDLAGLAVLPDLIKTGISSLKIEGRLKTPEYVANVTRVYREAIDRARETVRDRHPERLPDQLAGDYYKLEMAFSRGLHTGWLQGIDNQKLVHARFGKKRGVYLGQVTRIQNEFVTITLEAPLKPGDGVVFDNGHPATPEQGGRVYSVDKTGQSARLSFGRRDLDLHQIHIGDRVWKTSDPDLDRQLRQSFTGDTPQWQQPITIAIHGAVGDCLVAIARDSQGHIVEVASAMPLVAAHSQPLTRDRLQAQLGRLGNTPFCLGQLTSELEGDVMLPMSELNRLRRDMVDRLLDQRAQPQRWEFTPNASYQDLLPPLPAADPTAAPQLIVLVRHLHQLQAAIAAGVDTLYCEFEDPRKYSTAVQIFRQSHAAVPADSPLPSIWVAPPRITKPGENWILQQVRSANADGYLIRNYDQLQFFQADRCIADFSFNVANPITASYFQQFQLERLTASYDLNITQLTALLTSAPPAWFEVTIHQHMPMFHMEHCVFCAFLSNGTDFTNCGRPCETTAVKLRDRVGTEHVLQADAGCRNTVFNGTAQTGAEHLLRLVELGARHFRIEFVNETPEQVTHTIQRYRELLQGKIKGSQLWRELNLQNQLGVTRGTLR